MGILHSMKTKISLVLCVVTVWLTGCATPADIRARSPSLELTSSRPAKDVAMCISDRWENSDIWGKWQAGIPINMRQTQDGYTILASVMTAFAIYPGFLVDINDTPSGSSMRYFENAVAGASSLRNAVKEC